MINLDSITNENNKEHNEKWPYIPDHPYRILIIGGSGSGKTNTLLNLINEQNDIDKIYLYAKDLSKPKYEFLIKKGEDVGIKYCNDPNAFIEFSNTIYGVYENIDDCNPSRKRKILIVFYDMIADIMANKKFPTIICFLLIKMTVTDQLKIMDNKIKANQAQYDLDRLAVKISAYSSGDLRKYEYLTGEDLGYKPSVFEQAKFDYSPLVNIFD